MRHPSPYPFPRFNQRQTYRNRVSRPAASRLPTISSGRKFNRTVVLVDSTYENVPRGKYRQVLHEKGLVVSFIDMWTNWNEDEVHGAIEMALNGAIDPSKPYPR